MDLKRINNIVVVSDTHCGCRLGLCPRDGVSLDDGGMYQPSKFQKKIEKYFREFCEDFVPRITRGEPFALVVNGDAIDGVHHGATTQISQNIEDQVRCAEMILRPLVEKAEVYYHIRGTESHVGKSGVHEERLAQRLGASPNKEGQHARWFLWKVFGKDRIPGGVLCHFTHHIGTTGTSAYESTAVYKELVEAYVEAGRWRNRAPDVICRAHRHRCLYVGIPTENKIGLSFTTPGWQGKTPFVHKIPGGRQSEPQFGGAILRAGVEDTWYYRFFVKSLDRPEAE